MAESAGDAMRLKPKESDIQTAIIEAFWLQHRIRLDAIDAGGKGFRGISGGNGHSGIPKGFPDLLGSIPPNGAMLSIEVKIPGLKPSPEQVAFLERRLAEGGCAFWAISVCDALQKFSEWKASRG